MIGSSTGKFIAISLLWVVFGYAQQKQKVYLTSKLLNNQLLVGEKTTLEVTIHNAKIKPSVNYSMLVANKNDLLQRKGTTVKNNKLIFLFTVTAKSTGQMATPSFQIKNNDDGKIYSVNSHVYRVFPLSILQKKRSSGITCYGTVLLKKQKIYPNMKQVLYCKIAISKEELAKDLRINRVFLNIGQQKKLVKLNTRFVGSTKRLDYTEMPIEGKQYILISGQVDFVTNQVGEQEISELLIEAQKKTTITQRNNPYSFFSQTHYEYVKLVVPLQQKIVVEGLPAAGKPSFFNGNVGDYTIELLPLKRNTMQQQESLAVKLKVISTNGFNNFNPPVVINQKQWKTHDVSLQRTTGNAQQRIYTYLVSPKQSGKMKLYFGLSFFDLKQNKYREALAETPSIKVLPAAIATTNNPQVSNHNNSKQNNVNAQQLDVIPLSYQVSQSAVAIVGLSYYIRWFYQHYYYYLWVVVALFFMAIMSLIICRIKSKRKQNYQKNKAWQKLKKTQSQADFFSGAVQFFDRWRQTKISVAEQAEQQLLIEKRNKNCYLQQKSQQQISQQEQKKWLRWLQKICFCIAFCLLLVTSVTSPLQAEKKQPVIAKSWNQLATLATQAYHDREVKIAIKYYRDMLKIHPYHAATYYHLGLCYQQTGEINQAALAYHRALACDSHLYEAKHNLKLLLATSELPLIDKEKLSVWQQKIKRWPRASYSAIVLWGAIIMALFLLSSRFVSYRKWQQLVISMIIVLIMGLAGFIFALYPHSPYRSKLPNYPQALPMMVYYRGISLFKNPLALTKKQITQLTNKSQQEITSSDILNDEVVKLHLGSIVWQLYVRDGWSYVAFGSYRGWLPQTWLRNALPLAPDSNE